MYRIIKINGFYIPQKRIMCDYVTFEVNDGRYGYTLKFETLEEAEKFIESQNTKVFEKYLN